MFTINSVLPVNLVNKQSLQVKQTSYSQDHSRKRWEIKIYEMKYIKKKKIDNLIVRKLWRCETVNRRMTDTMAERKGIDNGGQNTTL